MLVAKAYEANLYWRCPNCGYEHNTMWYYEGNSSYNFKCGGCGVDVRVEPPNSENEVSTKQTDNIGSLEMPPCNKCPLISKPACRFKRNGIYCQASLWRHFTRF